MVYILLGEPVEQTPRCVNVVPWTTCPYLSLLCSVLLSLGHLFPLRLILGLAVSMSFRINQESRLFCFDPLVLVVHYSISAVY